MREAIAKPFDMGNVIGLPWLIFLGYWFVTAMRVNRMARREPAGSLLGRFALMGAAFYLLSGGDPRLGDLSARIFPPTHELFTFGAALTWAGIGFAIWARYHLGRFWSGTVALREGHQLIRSGPYAYIRHPIYTGILAAVLGTALAFDRYQGLVAFALVLTGFAWKASREEALLAGQFGAEFEEHRQHTGFFLPRFS